MASLVWEEAKLLVPVVVVSLLLGLASLYLAVNGLEPLLGEEPGAGGGGFVEEYHATLYGNGSLVEEYYYRVTSLGKHMLYRSWRAPLVFRGQPPGGGEGYIELTGVECPEGFIPYAYSYDGHVHYPSGARGVSAGLMELLRRHSSGNEAGCYNPFGLALGKYRVVYRYTIHPPLVCNGGSCLLDFSLASPGAHLYYRHVVVRLEGFRGKIAVFPLSLGPRVGEEDGAAVIEAWGVEPEQGVRLVLLSRLGAYPSTGIRIEGDPGKVFEETVGGEAFREKVFGELLPLLGGIWGVLAPFAILLAYRLYGTEPLPGGTGAVAARPGFPPSTGEKPWEVNVLYIGRGRPVGGVVVATILHLLARGILGARERDGRLELVLPGDTSGLDWFEKRVVELLGTVADNGVVDVERLEEVLKRDRARRKQFQRILGRLVSDRRSREYYRRATTSGRRPIAVLVAIGAGILLFIAVAFLLFPVEDAGAYSRAFLAWLVGLAAYVPALFLPRSIMGRWRPEYREKYYAWLSFREEARKALGGKRSGDAGPAAPVEGGNALEAAAYLLALGEDGLAEKLLKGTRLPRIGVAMYRVYYRFRRHSYLIEARGGGAGGGGIGGGGFGGGGAGIR